MLSLLAAFGIATVELDPRSADFGKAKVGKTRYDPWAGFAQVARYVSQVVRGERKTIGGGEVVEVGRGETIRRFGRSKLDPGLPAMFVDLIEGETFMGEEIDLASAGGLMTEVRRRLVPLFPEDVAEAVIEDGWTGVTGVGTMTYETPSEARRRATEEGLSRFEKIRAKQLQQRAGSGTRPDRGTRPSPVPSQVPVQPTEGLSRYERVRQLQEAGRGQLQGAGAR